MNSNVSFPDVAVFEFCLKEAVKAENESCDVYCQDLVDGVTEIVLNEFREQVKNGISTYGAFRHTLNMVENGGLNAQAQNT